MLSIVETWLATLHLQLQQKLQLGKKRKSRAEEEEEEEDGVDDVDDDDKEEDNDDDLDSRAEKKAKKNFMSKKKKKAAAAKAAATIKPFSFIRLDGSTPLGSRQKLVRMCDDNTNILKWPERLYS